MRSRWKLWMIAPLLCAWPWRASSDQSEVNALVAECEAANLPQATVDSCLERVRVLEETEPSARLQSLEGELEGHVSSVTGAGPSPSDNGLLPAGTAPPLSLQDGPAPGSVDAAKPLPPLSGADADDQPPIADPPDGTPSDDRAGDGPADDPQ